MVQTRKAISIVVVSVLLLSLATLLAPQAMASPATIHVPDDYSTIQAAITAADPYDTIIVGPGTYPENITINKSLTVRSSRGAERTTIDGNGSTVVDINVSGGTVSVSGFTITKGGHGIWAHNLGSNSVLRLEDNIITKNGSDGIYTSGSIYDGTITIKGNTVTDNDDDGIIVDSNLYDDTSVSIKDNTITDNGNDGIELDDVYDDATVSITNNNIKDNADDGIQFCEEFYNRSSVLVSDNTITGNNDDGIDWEEEAEDDSTVTFTGNTISGNSGDGIDIDELRDRSRMVISNNTISENGDDGVYLLEMDENYQLVLSPCNDIFDNSDYGFYNDSGYMVDATLNWWGHASGPGGVGPGSGDAVSDNVDYSPWLKFPCGVVVEADFSAEPTGGRAPLTVQFTDESTGDIDAWRWDFGDRDTSNEQNPTHRYAYQGSYTVTLEVSSRGATDTEVKRDYISVLMEPRERPARFLTTYPHIVPTRVLPNQPVNVLLNVKNVAASRGYYDAVLYVNGEVEYSQSAYLSPGETERLVFTVYRETPGNYWASVGKYGGWFTVAEAPEYPEYKVVSPPPPGGGLGTPAIIAIVLSSVAVGVAIFFATRPRRI